MNIISKLKQECQVRIGLYSAGLNTYWEQFKGLKECLESYNNFLEKKLYHGKRGSGVSVEAKVKQGPITTLGLTQTIDGKLKLNISEGEAINAPVLMNGNTSTHVRFGKAPQDYMNDWFKEAPTHHWALSVGHNAGLFIKAAELLNIDYAVF